MKYLLFIVVFFTAKPANAQRIVLPFNNDWRFSKDNFSFSNINLPHTWNTTDVMDDEPGYYRGVGWYHKKIKLPAAAKEKEVFLTIQAANQKAAVYVNGKKIAGHIGGYTAFSTRLTPWFYDGKAIELSIKVDNSHDKNIPPLTADFTFYGGLYRNIQLVAVKPFHFSFGEKGDKGIFISTPEVSATAASIEIESHISNDTKREKKLLVTQEIKDAGGKRIAFVKDTITTIGFKEKNIRQKLLVPQPNLWSPQQPYLYSVTSFITDIASGEKMDEQTNQLGLRWFSFDGEKGFFLNGKSLKLIGASRHQDFTGMGNAVPDSIAVKDVQLLKDMGANFLRVAHYPQSAAVLKACDELGILASVEIPVVNEITETDSFYNNCINMQQEMIRQYFNHSSVILWCYMNEILLRPSFNNDKERQKKYFANIALLAKRLDSVTKKEDPLRPTMIAHHGNYNLYKEVGLIDIPSVIGWNLYQGWYGAKIEDLPVYLDRFHQEYPNKPMMITEYGADADPRIRSNDPVRFDKSVEYATYYHRYYFKEIMQRPFIAGAQVWNLADFNSETRNETMPHINNKGLLEWNRTPKDPYYFYKAMLTGRPFIKILGPEKITATADSGLSTFKGIIKIASNAKRVHFIINDEQQIAETHDGIAAVYATLQNGINNIEVITKGEGTDVSDRKKMDCIIHPYILSERTEFHDLNILMGAKRFFLDSKGKLWMPDQPYRKGSWGSVGGKAFKLPKSSLPYGTDKNIKGTDDDPVYQTQLTGINSYKIDVPDGAYGISLHFAELLGGKVQGLVYSLNDGDRTEVESKREFNVIINDKTLLENFNISKEAGRATALVKTISVLVNDGNGIKIIFKPVEGEAVLNALQVKKIIKPE